MGRRLWAFPPVPILSHSGYACVVVSSRRLHLQAWLLTCEFGVGHRLLRRDTAVSVSSFLRALPPD
jgi:hypothetical protein